MWKPEYAENRRKKYQSDPEEREKRRKQGRSPEENAEYMRQYYQNNKEKFKEYREETRDRRNARRRERYQNDEQYREKCKSEVNKRSKKQRLIYRLSSEFGLDIETYNEMLESQNGRCAICGSKFGDRAGRRLSVDHCHKTGVVRGLLCSNCNLGLGKFKDNPKLLKKAITYLNKSHQSISNSEKNNESQPTLFDLLDKQTEAGED